MFYYCDCKNKNKKGYRQADYGQGIMALTEVDSEGICKDCGHYAVAFISNPSRNELNRYIKGGNSRHTRDATNSVVKQRELAKDNGNIREPSLFSESDIVTIKESGKWVQFIL